MILEMEAERPRSSQGPVVSNSSPASLTSSRSDPNLFALPYRTRDRSLTTNHRSTIPTTSINDVNRNIMHDASHDVRRDISQNATPEVNHIVAHDDSKASSSSSSVMQQMEERIREKVSRKLKSLQQLSPAEVILPTTRDLPTIVHRTTPGARVVGTTGTGIPSGTGDPASREHRRSLSASSYNQTSSGLQLVLHNRQDDKQPLVSAPFEVDIGLEKPAVISASAEIISTSAAGSLSTASPSGVVASFRRIPQQDEVSTTSSNDVTGSSNRKISSGFDVSILSSKDIESLSSSEISADGMKVCDAEEKCTVPADMLVSKGAMTDSLAFSASSSATSSGTFSRSMLTSNDKPVTTHNRKLRQPQPQPQQQRQQQAPLQHQQEHQQPLQQQKHVDCLSTCVLNISTLGQRDNHSPIITTNGSASYHWSTESDCSITARSSQAMNDNDVDMTLPASGASLKSFLSDTLTLSLKTPETLRSSNQVRIQRLFLTTGVMPSLTEDSLPSFVPIGNEATRVIIAQHRPSSAPASNVNRLKHDRFQDSNNTGSVATDWAKPSCDQNYSLPDGANTSMKIQDLQKRNYTNDTHRIVLDRGLERDAANRNKPSHPDGTVTNRPAVAPCQSGIPETRKTGEVIDRTARGVSSFNRDLNLMETDFDSQYSEKREKMLRLLHLTSSSSSSPMTSASLRVMTETNYEYSDGVTLRHETIGGISDSFSNHENVLPVNIVNTGRSPPASSAELVLSDHQRFIELSTTQAHKSPPTTSASLDESDVMSRSRPSRSSYVKTLRNAYELRTAPDFKENHPTLRPSSLSSPPSTSSSSNRAVSSGDHDHSRSSCDVNDKTKSRSVSSAEIDRALKCSDHAIIKSAVQDYIGVMKNDKNKITVPKSFCTTLTSKEKRSDKEDEEVFAERQRKEIVSSKALAETKSTCITSLLADTANRKIAENNDIADMKEAGEKNIVDDIARKISQVIPPVLTRSVSSKAEQVSSFKPMLPSTISLEALISPASTLLPTTPLSPTTPISPAFDNNITEAELKSPSWIRRERSYKNYERSASVGSGRYGREGRGRSPEEGREVELQLVKGSLGLGFCIEGGIGSPAGDKPITIKRLYKGETAAKGLLVQGDEILRVNDQPFSGYLSHYRAWNYLTALPDGVAHITVRRNTIKTK